MVEVVNPQTVILVQVDHLRCKSLATYGLFGLASCLFAWQTIYKMRETGLGQPYAVGCVKHSHVEAAGSREVRPAFY